MSAAGVRVAASPRVLAASLDLWHPRRWSGPSHDWVGDGSTVAGRAGLVSPRREGVDMRREYVVDFLGQGVCLSPWGCRSTTVPSPTSPLPFLGGKAGGGVGSLGGRRIVGGGGGGPLRSERRCYDGSIDTDGVFGVQIEKRVEEEGTTDVGRRGLVGALPLHPIVGSR